MFYLILSICAISGVLLSLAILFGRWVAKEIIECDDFFNENL